MERRDAGQRGCGELVEGGAGRCREGVLGADGHFGVLVEVGVDRGAHGGVKGRWREGVQGADVLGGCSVGRKGFRVLMGGCAGC